MVCNSKALAIPYWDYIKLRQFPEGWAKICFSTFDDQNISFASYLKTPLFHQPVPASVTSAPAWTTTSVATLPASAAATVRYLVIAMCADTSRWATV